eukprot:scaffold7551_cov19-Prasinocladus_malaysianus.AAC.1
MEAEEQTNDDSDSDTEGANDVVVKHEASLTKIKQEAVSPQPRHRQVCTANYHTALQNIFGERTSILKHSVAAQQKLAGRVRLKSERTDSPKNRRGSRKSAVLEDSTNTAC